MLESVFDVLNGAVALAGVAFFLRWLMRKLTIYDSETCVGVAAILGTRLLVDLYLLRRGASYLWVDIMILSLGASWMLAAPSLWSVGYCGLYFLATIILGALDFLAGRPGRASQHS